MNGLLGVTMREPNLSTIPLLIANLHIIDSYRASELCDELYMYAYLEFTGLEE
jgi:hypothetical protein